jgi:hypothetical protein
MRRARAAHSQRLSVYRDYDHEDSHLFVVDVVAPFSGIAEMMVLAQLHSNVETSALVDKATRVDTRRAD